MTEKEKEALIEAIEKANCFLYREGSYFKKSEKLIKEVFRRKENVKERIIILDCIYSTSLRTNRYEVDDLLKELEQPKYENLKEIKNDISCLEKLGLQEIFTKKFGLDNEERILKSFLSKYFFFLTEFNFPLYDEHVRSSYDDLIFDKTKKTDKINKKINTHPPIPYQDVFEKLKYVKDKLKISFKELDRFLWLYGKLKGKNYTTFLSKEEFEKISRKEPVVENLESFCNAIDDIKKELKN